MMKLKVIGTGSSGNCYLLENDTEALLIECGLPLAAIKRGMGYKMAKLKACIVSHSHKDHARSVKELKWCGLRTIGPEGTEATIIVKGECMLNLGGFKIRPLPVQHDVSCMAYVVDHPEMGRLLFVTDTVSFPYIVKGLNHILMEANYCDEQMQDNIDAGLIPASLRDRVMTSHMSIDGAVRDITAQDLSKVHDILLIHLSQGNGDPDTFKARVEEATGIPTQTAVPGLEMELNVEPY